MDDNLANTVALVVDPNPTSRSVLVAQLRGFGIKSVVQCSRLADARRQLEYRKFDVVLCELEFGKGAGSGQELLDDLRRNQLLPFSTVFIMVTGEATYAKVAEAAESALDGYLLKPHSASQLAERLLAARTRKAALEDIFAAIEAEEFEQAAAICLKRFEERAPFWLYAARVGAELLLRIGKYAKAQAMYEAVVEAKTLPWAKLGVARSMLDAGQLGAATTTLESLISSEPNYVDAYEVLGKAQFELGRMDKALNNYKMACDLTPDSISRMQTLGMVTYYCGNRIESEKILDRTTRMGLDSKMFDCQTLVLLALTRFEIGDRKGLLRCRDDFARILERQPGVLRLERLSEIVHTLSLMQDHQLGKALERLRGMSKTITQPDFDFEAACNMVSLMAQLAQKSIQLEEVEQVVDGLALRFCSSRTLTELLAGAAHAYERYAVQIREAQGKILKLTEQAMAFSMKGNPQGTVVAMIALGRSTLNSKVIETAHGVLTRHAEKIPDAVALNEQVDALRADYARTVTRPTLGDPKRQAGGLQLRVGLQGPNPVVPAGA